MWAPPLQLLWEALYLPQQDSAHSNSFGVALNEIFLCKDSLFQLNKSSESQSGISVRVVVHSRLLAMGWHPPGLGTMKKHRVEIFLDLLHRSGLQLSNFESLHSQVQYLMTRCGPWC